MYAAAVFVLALVLLTAGVGAGYWGRDEAEYAGVAHEMNASGDFLVPRLFGRLYPDKPPLSEWLTAASFRVFGEREAAGRLPHVLLAAGSGALLLILGTRLFDLRRGALASLLFSTSFLFVIYGRLLLTDSDLLFFTLACLLGLLQVLQGSSAVWAIPVAGLALGLAILAKGPVALLAPSLFCAGYLAGGGVRSSRPLLRLALVLAAALAVSLPWFLLAARETAGQTLGAFLLRENLYRFLRPMEGHRGSLIYFGAVLWFGFFPWSGLLVLLFRRDTLQRSPSRWALLSCAGGTLGFFSLAATKLPHYLLPAMPAVALLAADAAWPRLDSQARAAAWATAATGVALFAGVLAAVRMADEPGALALLLPVAAASLLCLMIPLLDLGERTRRLRFFAAILACAVLAFGVAPAADPLRSTNRLGLAARAARLAGEPVGGLDIREAALTYYAGGSPTQMWKTADALARAVESSPTRTVLVWLDSARTVSIIRFGLSVRILAEGPSPADPRVRDRLQLCRVRLAFRRER